MAQSWLRLAEHADRVHPAPELVPEHCTGDEDEAKADTPHGTH
jgi:hypothetical protein